MTTKEQQESYLAALVRERSYAETRLAGLQSENVDNPKLVAELQQTIKDVSEQLGAAGDEREPRSKTRK